MNSGDFMGLISDHYNDIITLFKSRSYNIGIQFDEDIFGDAFIKCVKRFENEIITYDVAIKYFWITYLNAVKSQFANSIKYNIVEIENALEIAEDSSNSSEIYNTIMDAITVAFSEEDMQIYRLYKYHNWSEKDLIEAGLDCTDLIKRIKEIHKFVKQYSKEHIKSR